MCLSGKTRAEIEEALINKSREDLLDLIHRLVSFENLLTAREIAEASHIPRRLVLGDMRAGRFVDPIHGAGYFSRSAQSFRVSSSAANAWRASFFVPVRALPSGKKYPRADIGVGGKNSAQNGDQDSAPDQGNERERDAA
jgi:hypothetical protein